MHQVRTHTDRAGIRQHQFPTEQNSLLCVLLTRSNWLRPRDAGLGMCEKCAEIDKKIEHYKNLSFLITDQRTLDGIKQLIGQLEAEKAAMHPEQE
jgi:hypothetical protein